MTDRIGISAGLALVLAALGCGAQSKSRFHESPSTGRSSGDAGSGGASGISGAGGGDSGNGGNGGSSAAGGDSGDRGDGGAGARAGSGATSGGGGVPNAGASGNPSGGAGAGAAGSGGAELDGPLSGDWGMFWFEDPVAVRIRQQGQALSGMGCCAGISESVTPLLCCGPVEGMCADGHADFALSIEDFSAIYGTDVYVSADYQRMGGTFSVDGGGSLPVAWARLPAGEGYLGTPPTELSEELMPRAGSFELMLSSAFVGRFEPVTPFELQLSASGFLRGEFGPFYWREMSWDAESETLSVGPVPATDPGYATSLELHFDGITLKSVVATYPDDPPYSFVVTGTTG
jgi:hypothetical protein